MVFGGTGVTGGVTQPNLKDTAGGTRSVGRGKGCRNGTGLFIKCPSVLHIFPTQPKSWPENPEQDPIQRRNQG